jgi:hypothetical protein
MTVRRWFCVAVLLILASGSGCQSWCSRHYPCPQPAAYPAYGYGAPAACCPPGCAPASGYPAAAPAWNAPQPVACPPGCRPS